MPLIAEEELVSADKTQSQLLSEFSAILSKHLLDSQGTPPSTLHHYTTSEGLIGILGSSELRASDTRFLNDSSELDYGVRLVRGIVDLLKPEVQPEAYTQLASAAASIGFLGISPIFAFCLSRNRNQLSQWRAYCGPDGCSIEFDTATLNSLMPSYRANVGLYRILYEPSAQEELIRRMLTEFCIAEERVTDADSRGRLTARLANFLLKICARMKDPAFKEEDEWRLVAAAKTAEQDSDFRSVRGHIVPYIPFKPVTDGAPLPILSVTCGPGPHASLQRDVIGRLMKHYKYDVTIHASDIPLRH